MDFARPRVEEAHAFTIGAALMPPAKLPAESQISELRGLQGISERTVKRPNDEGCSVEDAAHAPNHFFPGPLSI
jgi:hypothetical protein